MNRMNCACAIISVRGSVVIRLRSIIIFWKITSKVGIMDWIASAILLVAGVLTLSSVEAYFVSVDAHAEECFFDKVTSGTKMSLMFEVAEGGFLDIDVKVGLN